MKSSSTPTTTLSPLTPPPPPPRALGARKTCKAVTSHISGTAEKSVVHDGSIHLEAAGRYSKIIFVPLLKVVAKIGKEMGDHALSLTT